MFLDREGEFKYFGWNKEQWRIVLGMFNDMSLRSLNDILQIRKKWIRSFKNEPPDIAISKGMPEVIRCSDERYYQFEYLVLSKNDFGNFIQSAQKSEDTPVFYPKEILDIEKRVQKIDELEAELNQLKTRIYTTKTYNEQKISLDKKGPIRKLKI